ncbi:MAG: DUF2809 domain-containing protein [Flavobacteriales bacterium]|nr:DUF2809 domain-containing protein [Flavobacteriales bacterium]
MGARPLRPCASTPYSASLAALLFVIEVLIALFVRDSFVRPYFGDVLVVMLIFFTLLALWPGPPVRLAMGVLLFAFVVEATRHLGRSIVSGYRTIPLQSW